MDYGKFNYEQKKHQRDKRAKERGAAVEIKSIQIKVGTSAGDLRTKIVKIEEWLSENQRVKVELYLQGRSKYVEKAFLHDRLQKFLALIVTPYTIVENFKEAPKGISLIVERNKKAPVKEVETSDLNSEAIAALAEDLDVPVTEE